MKLSIILLLSFLSQLIYAQDSEALSVVQLTYDYKFKVFEDDDQFKNEMMLLSINGSKMSFMPRSQYKLDSIYFITKKPAPTIEAEMSLIGDMQKSKNPYRVYTENNTVKYRRSLNVNHYEYKEDLDLKWNLLPGSKNILGYECREASTRYAGRVWHAWYAVDIPFNAGPYKFKGLPGLILNVYDKQSLFDFKAISLEQVNFIEYDPTTPVENNDVVENIEPERFMKLLKSFDKLSIVEKFSFGMNQKVKVRSADGEDISRKVNQRSTKKRLYIESY